MQSLPPMRFRSGTVVVQPHGKHRRNGAKSEATKYLRISAGPQRGKYVHVAIMEAVLGRELEKDETVEHRDGNGLNVGWNEQGEFNLVVVTKKMNSHLRHVREKRARAKENGQRELIPWEGQF